LLAKWQRRREWRRIIKGQKPYHELERKKAQAYIKRMDFPPAILMCLIDENDPHQNLKGKCPYCGAWGSAMEMHGWYPCVYAPYWHSGEALYQAQRRAADFEITKEGNITRREKSSHIAFS